MDSNKPPLSENFFDVVKARRSIRRFTEELVPDSVIEKALQSAVLAPNSSNIQTWNFYWVQSEDKKTKLVEACLSQSAARTANQLLVITANQELWKRSQSGLIDWVKSSKAPKPVLFYYEKIIPFTYRSGFLNILAPFKWLTAFSVGLFRPITRGPITANDIQQVCVKSAALACENFVLAITAQGYSSCMMEGFDEVRLKKLLNLKSKEKAVMVIGVGRAAENGTWGDQYRIPLDQVVHKV